MWEKLSFVFVTFVSSVIFVPSIHFFFYSTTIFLFPFWCTLSAIAYDLANIPFIIEIYNSAPTVSDAVGNLPPEVRADFILKYKVYTWIVAFILGIWSAISLAWLLVFGI